MLKESYPYYLANRAQSPNRDLEVIDKYSGEVATRVSLADSRAIDEAIGKAVLAQEPMREMASYERQAILQHCVQRFAERSEELAMALCIEAGKPIIFCGDGDTAGIIRSANAGVVVPPEDYRALAEEIAKLADSPGLARTMGRRGCDYVHKVFNKEKLLRRLDRVLMPSRFRSANAGRYLAAKQVSGEPLA